MRKIPVLSLFFVALLVAGSANGRVCFLADIECQAGQQKPLVVEPGQNCPDHLIAEDEQCPSIAYEAACEDSTGIYYEPLGCKAGFVDMDALIPEDGSNRRYRDLYTCASGYECGNCCPEADLRCPSSYKVCPNNTVISTSAFNDTCEENGVVKSKYCECDKRIYTFTKADCENRGLTLVGICTEGVSTTMRGTGCECPEGTERVSRTEVSNCPAECECGCTRSKGATPIPGTTYACVGVATCDACPTVSCVTENGEYETQLACESSVANSVCEQNTNSCWVVSGCATNVYQLSKDQDLKDLDTTIPTDKEGDFVCQDDNCSVDYTDKDGTTSKVEGCEPECVSLGYKYCDSNNNEDGILKHIFCLNSPRKYYTGCEAKNMCYKVTLNDQRFYSDGGYCELVTPVDEAQQYLNNGYYAVTNCLPLGVPSDNVSERKTRMHACESDDLDCMGNYSPVHGRNTALPIEGTCLNAEDGRIEECGGKNYTVDCECNHVGEVPSGCVLLEIPNGSAAAGTPYGTLLSYKTGKQTNPDRAFIFTGEVKQGCEKFGKKFGYFRNVDDTVDNYYSHDRLCLDTTQYIYGEAKTLQICDTGDSSRAMCDGVTFDVFKNKYNRDSILCDGRCVSKEKYDCKLYAQEHGIGYAVGSASGSCIMHMDGNSYQYEYRTITLENGTKCRIAQDCEAELTGYCATSGLYPSDWEPQKTGRCTMVGENVSEFEYTRCGSYYYGNDTSMCCKSRNGVHKTVNSTSDYNILKANGFTDVSTSYDYELGCYYLKCDEGSTYFNYSDASSTKCCPKFAGVTVTTNRSEANREGYINITADYADQAPEGCYYYKKDVKCADKQSTGCPVVVDEGTSVDLNTYYKVKTEGGCDYYGACLSDIADCGGGKSPTAIYDETTGERINLVKESQCDNVKQEDKVVGEVCGGPYYTQCFLQTQ